MRRFWWVNQKQTFKHERQGGYLWSPKTKRNGHRNPYYDFMRVVAPGDLVLSYVSGHIVAVGVAMSPCYESPKPTEFGRAGENWHDIGWRVDVAYQDLASPLRPADHMAALQPLLPARYAPLQQDGRGQQNLYLTSLPPSLMSQLALLIGAPVLDYLDQAPSIMRDPWREDNPVQERWERRLAGEIRSLHDVPETTREQLIDARVGQGLFRKLVYARESSCRVTGVDRPEHLVASHIRPWRHSDNDQRLDPENGFMLTPNVDHLFDRGFLTFSDQGKAFFSPAAHRESLLKMGFDPDRRVDVGTFTAGQRRHLEFHRDAIFLGTRDDVA